MAFWWWFFVFPFFLDFFNVFFFAVILSNALSLSLFENQSPRSVLARPAQNKIHHRNIPFRRLFFRFRFFFKKVRAKCKLPPNYWKKSVKKSRGSLKTIFQHHHDFFGAWISGVLPGMFRCGFSNKTANSLNAVQRILICGYSFLQCILTIIFWKFP
jgi:hypothetical protein